jgi:hypothetical protein
LRNAMPFILSRVSGVPLKPDNPGEVDHALYITVIYTVKQ